MDKVMPAGLGTWGRFLTSGVFNTLVTYLLYLALLPRLHYRISFTIAYASGIALAYALNRFLVFRQPGGRAGPLLVTLIYLGQYVVNLAIVSVAVRWFHVPAALAPLCAIVMTVPLTYVLNRRVFGGGRDEPAGLSLTAWMRPWARPVALAVLVGLPILSLALNAIAWLRFGFDLPFFDDWRAYESGDVDSLEFTYLFQALNDTLTPIGLALDTLVQRVLDGNSILYQLLSMLFVLGALLVLQWKLLRIALGDPLRTAICFVFTLLMLQPGSYWGRENIAYLQALPLVFILSALWLGVARPWRDLWNLPAIFVLAVLSGLTYISGAFGAFAAGAGVVVMALQSRKHAGRMRTLRAGAALALGGAVTSAIQLVMAVLPSKGGTHAEDKVLALPHEADFWMFYLGKVGRSLLLPADSPLVSLAIVALALAGFVAALVLTLRAARRVENEPARFLAFSGVFAAVGAMVVTYLALVAAGRANFRPDDVQAASDVFAFGFQRFHFFWATLVWPWLVAALMIASERRVPGPTPVSVRRVGAVALGAAVAAMVSLGALDH
ncbi:MAG: GtrA family protein, partial [Ramlibacter sp.]